MSVNQRELAQQMNVQLSLLNMVSATGATTPIENFTIHGEARQLKELVDRVRGPAPIRRPA